MHNLPQFSVFWFNVLPAFRKLKSGPFTKNMKHGLVFVHHKCSLLFAQGYPLKHKLFFVPSA
jgi:hypothetical protein